jgi:hypothetical protein
MPPVEPEPGSRDPRVDAYLDRLPRWQRETLERARALIHEADGDIAETIKFGDRPYFVLGGNVCAFLAAKDHVNVFLYDGGIAPDPQGIVTGGHENQTARQIAIGEGTFPDERAFVALIRSIAETNRAGGWRAIKRG